RRRPARLCPPAEERPHPGRSEPHLEPVTDDGIGDGRRRQLRDLHRRGISGVTVIWFMRWDYRRNAVSFLGMNKSSDHVRIGRAAEMLGVTVDTIRRWSEAGRLQVTRMDGGHGLIPMGQADRL